MPDAGWYPDPHNPELMRYWDGSAWTGYTRTPEAASPEPPPFVAPPPSGQPAAVYRPPDQVNDVGQWLKQSFRVAWRRLGTCFALTVIGVLPLVVVAALAGLALYNGGQDGGLGGLSVALLVLAGLVAVASMVWFGVITIAQYRVLYDGHRDIPISVGEALAVGRRNIGRLIVAYLIVYGIGLAVLLVVFALGAVLVVSAGSVEGWEDGIERAIPLLNLVNIASLPVSFWLTVKLAFIPVAAAVAPRDSGVLRTSMQASNGQFWPVLGRVLLLSLIITAVFIPIYILLAIIVVAGVVTVESDAASIAPVMLLGGLAGLLFGLAIYVAQIVQASGMARLYRDLGGPLAE